MASSVIGILSTLGLSTDSTLEEILTKLVDYNLVTTDEIHNIQNISVKPLPNIVRNQADILKQRMYGIATDEEYGLPIVINRRMVLIRYILDKLNIKLDDLIKELDDGTFVVNKSKNDADGNNITTTYETKSNAKTNYDTLGTKIETLKTYLLNGNILVKKAEQDESGNNITTTYETKADSTTKFNNSKTYTDTKFNEVKLILDTLMLNAPEAYDTLKEIADYIANDITGAEAILSSITELQNNKVDKTTTVNGKSLSDNIALEKSDVGLGNVDNTSDAEKPISNAVQSALNQKANSTNVYNKTEMDVLLEELRDAIDALSGVDEDTQIELQNYYKKTETYNKTETDTAISTLGADLQQQINNIKSILTSDDVDFDTLQELVTALKNNVASIDDIFSTLSKKADTTYVDAELLKKVDKVEGKGLSTNDYTTEDKNKLSNLENYDDTELREEIDTKIGDINSILDQLNGEVV